MAPAYSTSPRLGFGGDTRKDHRISVEHAHVYGSEAVAIDAFLHGSRHAQYRPTVGEGTVAVACLMAPPLQPDASAIACTKIKIRTDAFIVAPS
jgi:hypothetical protein